MRLSVYVDGLSRNVKLQYSYLDLFSGRCSQVVGREYFARNTSKGSALLSGDNYTGNRIGGYPDLMRQSRRGPAPPEPKTAFLFECGAHNRSLVFILDYKGSHR